MNIGDAIRSHTRFDALLKAGEPEERLHGIAKEIARDVGTTAGVVRDVAFGNATDVAEAIRKHGAKEKQLAVKTAATFGGTTVGGGLGAGMGARVESLKPKPGILTGIKELLDGVRGVDTALADGKIELHEVWELIELQRDFGGITAKERNALAALYNDHRAAFEPLAAHAMERFLALSDPNAKPAQDKPAALRRLWDNGRRGFPATRATSTTAPPPDALSQAARIFSVSTNESQKEAGDVALWFKQYPSNGGAQIVAFHNQWATWDTLSKNPLQAFLYHTTRAFDDDGKPRGARWQAYATAVETGAPPAVIEEAFLRAHVDDFQTMLANPKFNQLYALSTPEYRNIVDAYVETLTILEKRLDAGEDPVMVARSLTPETMRCLLKRGTLGMIWTPQVFSQSFNFKNETTRNMWRAFWDIAKNVVFHVGKREPPATKLSVQLSAAQAADLAARTGLPLKPGANLVDKAAFKDARFSEPDRGGAQPLRSYPLRFEDFTQARAMRQGGGMANMAGADGVFSAEDIEGVLRHVQSRVRSQLIADFHAKYPVPQGGILSYSANMLAMNGAYIEHSMFGDLPNRIMPVDNDGKPKNALWQAFVDASVSHKKTGAPSQEKLELLWLKAHMKDFEAVDTPEFQAKLSDFWQQAALDPVMAPMAIYTKAMLLGRKDFESATTQGVPEEVAFSRSLGQFAKTMLEFRTFPFWQNDLRELSRLLFDTEVRNQPDVDDRGLATDRALIERAIGGIKDMFGLARIVLAGTKMAGVGDIGRVPTDKMVELAAVLSPAKLAQLDPRIVAFYANPTKFDVTTGVEMPWLNRIFMGEIGSFLSCQGRIPDRVRGFEGYPLEMDLYRDPAGHTHWDRHVVVDGKRRTLFHAKFETVNDNGRPQLKETFVVGGKEVGLYFDADVKDGKLVLAMDKEHSEKMARCSMITFTTGATKDGLVTKGDYLGTGIDCTGTVEFHISPK